MMKRIIVLIFLLIPQNLHAETVHIAVAANFLTTAKAIATAFEQKTGNTIIISSGATGMLYAQIKQGAPYDILLAADSLRPQLLENEGNAVLDSRFTYALGRLVLWTPQMNAENALKKEKIKFLALADPKAAPYGTAAEQTLEKLGLKNNHSFKILYGKDIAQVFQTVASGNAEAGFVALSQIIQTAANSDNYWIIPDDYYTPIAQQAILLTKAKNNTAAKQFLAFLKESTALIRQAGYN